MADYHAKCIDCRAEFTEEECKGISACPKCGGKGVPLGPDWDVNIAVNWQELRILTMWAERWAHQCNEPGLLKTVYAIAKALQDQCPSFAPLTFAGEIADVKAEFGADNVQVFGLPDSEDPPMPPKVS